VTECDRVSGATEAPSDGVWRTSSAPLYGPPSGLDCRPGDAGLPMRTGVRSVVKS